MVVVHGRRGGIATDGALDVLNESVLEGDRGGGMAVHVGARVGALAGPGEVLTSRTVRDLSSGSGLAFESLGPQHLKGVPEDIEVFRVRAN